MKRRTGGRSRAKHGVSRIRFELPGLRAIWNPGKLAVAFLNSF